MLYFLVMEVQGDRDYPEELRNVTPKEADSALPQADKTAPARKLVHDETYCEQKNRIRGKMAGCVEALKRQHHM